MGVAVRERVFRPALRGISMITGALVVAAGLTVVSESVTAGSASAAQSPTSCQGGVSLVNGGFEQPTAPAGSWGLFTEAQVPGWSTTDSRGQIELWSSGFMGVPAPAGTQFAELNANSASRLYQDVATTNGAPTRTPQPKVVAAAVGSGVGAAISTIGIYAFESLSKVDLPETVEGSVLVLVSACVAFLAGYVKRPSANS